MVPGWSGILRETSGVKEGPGVFRIFLEISGGTERKLLMEGFGMDKEGSWEFGILPGGSGMSKRVIPMLLNNAKSTLQSKCSEISRAIPCQHANITENPG